MPQIVRHSAASAAREANNPAVGLSPASQAGGQPDVSSAENEAPAAPDPARMNLATRRELAAAANPPPSDSVFHLSNGATPRAPYVAALDQLFFPQDPAGRRVVRVPAQADLASLRAYAAEQARINPAAGRAQLVLYPLGAERTSANRTLVSGRVHVKLADPAVRPGPMPELGITAWRFPSYAPGHAIAIVEGALDQPLLTAAALAARPQFTSAEPIVSLKAKRAAVLNDPLLVDQWHLRNTGQQQGPAGYDIRAIPAWDSSVGSSITIGILDDGVDGSHPDLADAYRGDLSKNFLDEDDASNASPRFANDNHGTAVAGLAAARGNNRIGVAGVAPGARIASLRILESPPPLAPVDEEEEMDPPTADELFDIFIDQVADALVHENQNLQVKNNSWGPTDEVFSPPELLLLALADSANNGRGGRGTIHLFATGNSFTLRDGFQQGAKDGLSASRYVVAIGATNANAGPASFSEGGPHLIASAPGEGPIGVVTTDRVLNPSDTAGGYNPHTIYNPVTDEPEFVIPNPLDYSADFDYTKTFSGTSAACPIASGVVALMLDVRPELGWRDVKEILLRSSTQLMPNDPEWVTRPAGLPSKPIKHHPRFGGGMVNALEAVTLARTWTNLGPEVSVVSSTLTNLDIPQAGEGAIRRIVAVPNTPIRVEHAELTIRVLYSFRGNLEISLISPSGTVSSFTKVSESDLGADFEGRDGGGFTFTSVRHWGETSVVPGGNWVIQVRDGLEAFPTTGLLATAQLTLYGTEIEEPTLLSSPSSQTLASGSTVLLSAGFAGGNLTYQWQLNGQDIPRATRSTYLLPKLNAARAGTYTCIATNAAGTATTTPAVITLSDTPVALDSIRVGSTTDVLPITPDGVRVWRASGLPRGMRVDPATGRLLGRPTRAGNYNIVLRSSGTDGSLILYRLSLSVTGIPAESATQYTALIARDATLNAGLGGDISVRVNPNGTFTGRVRLGATTHAISGLVDTNETGDLFLHGPLSRASGFSYEVFIPVGTSTPEVSGFILGPGSVSPRAFATLTGEVSPWSSANPLPAGLRGNYTFALTIYFSDDIYPRGPVVGILEAKADGSVVWTLYPSDGSQLVRGIARVSVDGTVVLYAPSLSPTRGSILGTLEVSESSSTLAGDLTWLRLSTEGLSRLPATQAYRAGFGPVGLNIFGGRYSRTTPVTDLTSPGSTLELRYLSRDIDGSSAFEVTGDVVVAANASTLTSASLPPALAFRGAISRANGLVTGRFTAGSPARVINYTAVVLADDGLIFGSFIVLPAPGTSGTATGGEITLGQNNFY